MHLEVEQLRRISVACMAVCAAWNAAAQSIAPSYPLPAVTVYTSPDLPPMESAPGSMGVRRVLNVDALNGVARLDAAMVDAGWVAWDASNSLGLAQGISVRGFSLSNQGTSQLQASRILLNGHADIAWRFSRDPATIESAQIIGGSDATLMGAGTPGGTLLLTSKSPTGQEFTRLQGQLGSNGGKRVVLDAERDLGPLQLRGVVVSQRGDTTVEKVDDSHRAALISAVLPTRIGKFQLDVERHHSDMPFPFGTAYAGERFWLDHAYVDPRTSQADRNFNRQSIYWTQPLGDAVTLKVHGQHVNSSRQETLLGFYDPLNAIQLRGYYRTIDETSQQTDYGVRLDGDLLMASVRHSWSAAWLSHRQQRQFAGPQNIGGFTLDLENPQYPAQPETLPLSKRYAFEDYRESGLGMADRIQWGPWELRGGLRWATLATDSSTALGVQPVAVARADTLSRAWGVGRTFDAGQRAWLTRTESFMPNRGQLSSGAWLPESRGTQWEIGWAWQGIGGKAPVPSLSMTLFDLLQTNLPARDPVNSDAYIVLGAMHSAGLEMQTSVRTGTVQWTASATLQNARVKTPTRAGQGSYLPGVAQRYGALHVAVPVTNGLRAWARVQAAASRPGDSVASFSVPGYGVLGVGLQNATPNPVQWGIQIDNVLDASYVRALTGADNVWQGPRRGMKVWLDAKF